MGDYDEFVKNYNNELVVKEIGEKLKNMDQKEQQAMALGHGVKAHEQQPAKDYSDTQEFY